MTQLFTPGPAQIFVGTGAAGALEFLGFSTDQVVIDLTATESDAHADFGGPMVPVDVQYMGEQATIPVTLARYSETILNKMAARVPSLTAGAMAANEVGSLMVTEGYAVRILINCPYVAKTAYSTMNPAYNFLAGWLSGRFTVPCGTRVKLPGCVFRCIPLWAVNAGVFTATLYNSTNTGMPSIT